MREFNPELELLRSISQLRSFGMKASGSQAPESLQRAEKHLQDAIAHMKEYPSIESRQGVLISVGRAQAELAIHHDWASENFAPFYLCGKEWIEAAADDTPEWRLASALASVCVSNVSHRRLRTFLEPVTDLDDWLEEDRVDPVPNDNLEDFLHTLLQYWIAELEDPLRPAILVPDWFIQCLVAPETSDNVTFDELMFAEISDKQFIPWVKVLARRPLWRGTNPNWHVTARCFARLEDINLFLNHQIDEPRLYDLTRALMLFSRLPSLPTDTERTNTLVPPAYALLRLSYSPWVIQRTTPTRDPTILHRFIAGEEDAPQLARRHLLANRLKPVIDAPKISSAQAKRIAAALAFPISRESTETIANQIL